MNTLQFGAITRFLPTDSNVDANDAKELGSMVATEAYESQGIGSYRLPTATFLIKAPRPSGKKLIDQYVLATGEDAVILNGLEKSRQTTPSNSLKQALTRAIVEHVCIQLSRTSYTFDSYPIDAVQKLDDGKHLKTAHFKANFRPGLPPIA